MAVTVNKRNPVMLSGAIVSSNFVLIIFLVGGEPMYSLAKFSILH